MSDSSSKEFKELEQSYRSDLKGIFSKVDNKEESNNQVAFGYSRIKSFKRAAANSETDETRQRRNSAAEEINAEFEAIFNVLGEADDDNAGKLVPQAEAQLKEKIINGVERELTAASVDAGGNYVAGELNFFRQITKDDVKTPIMEDAILATYGSWITDCNCDNGTRADYAVCEPIDPEVHVRLTIDYGP